MEEKITKSLDNLTIQQTERLLDENMEMKISIKDRNRIKNSVFEKIGSNKKKRIYLHKKFVACAAAITIIFTSLSIVGFNNVYAAVSKLFTFIPGVAINYKSDTSIYTIDPIIRQVNLQNSKANVVRAVYMDGYLSVTIEVEGAGVNKDDYSFYINQKLMDYSGGFSSFSGGGTAEIIFSIKSDTPTSDDIYEVGITGFSQHLSFKMALCSDYDEIAKIGPTDIQNGISITTTATRIDNQLTIWCYPFKTTNTTNDMIVGYGDSNNGVFNQEKYIETESGKIFDNAKWKLNGRLIFDMPDNDKTATLHIPFLSMSRNEKRELNVNFPKEFIKMESDASIKCSLGTIKITEVQRSPNGKDKDTVRLKFNFDSKDSNLDLYSFKFNSDGKYSSYVQRFNDENGHLDYLELDVDKNQNKISLDIINLYFYQFGEYVIPLNIQ